MLSLERVYEEARRSLRSLRSRDISHERTDHCSGPINLCEA
jgi:hypothetical protein